MGLVLFERQGAVGTVTLNDPDSLNAMGEAMATEASALVGALAKEKLHAIILTGAGRAFSAGGDLQMLQRKTAIGAEENKRLMLAFYNSFLSLRSLGVPLVAAINGHAIGAGLCLACGCDIRLGTERAKFGFTFTKLGLHPGMGATFFVRQVIGHAAAGELLLTGRVIEAQEAFRLGLISQIAKEGEVVAVARRVVEELLECGPEATKQLLESIRSPLPTLGESLQREATCQSVNYAGQEFREGVQAVIEKRKPRFIF